MEKVIIYLVVFVAYSVYTAYTKAKKKQAQTPQPKNPERQSAPVDERRNTVRHHQKQDEPQQEISVEEFLKRIQAEVKAEPETVYTPKKEPDYESIEFGEEVEEAPIDNPFNSIEYQKITPVKPSKPLQSRRRVRKKVNIDMKQALIHDAILNRPKY